MVETIGAVGMAGCALITTLAEDIEVQPVEILVTLKVQVPEANPETVVLTPLPLMVVPSGVLVIVHAEVEGNPFNITLPVAKVQVGWVIVPTVGAGGAVEV